MREDSGEERKKQKTDSQYKKHDKGMCFQRDVFHGGQAGFYSLAEVNI
jgi:hypothetical protein